jgi:TolB protein
LKPFRLIAWAIVLLLLSAFAPPPARAILYIDINAPGGRKMPVALPDFLVASGDAELGTALPRIIAGSLDMTGLFEVIPHSATLEKIVPSHFAGTPLSFPDWKIIGAEAVVIGKVEDRDGRAVVEMRLYDATLGRMMAGKRYTAPPGQARRVAHKFANEVLYAFTGVMGIFDTEIAFSARSPEGKGKEIFIVGMDGEGLRQITDNRSFNLFPRWSPDGNVLVYTSFRTGTPQLHLRTLADDRERMLVLAGNTKTPGSFSPDGSYLYAAIGVEGNSNIYRLPVSGGPAEKIVVGWGLEVSPSLSPDGKRMAFVSNRSGAPQVYVKEIGSSVETRVSYAGYYATSPSWSPAGDRIAFTSVSGGIFSIYTVRPDGSDQRLLVSRDGDCIDPSFSPDGRYLVYTYRKKGYSDLRLISADGRWEKTLFSGLAGAGSPSWSPRP